MTNLPVVTPVDAITISPEALEIANCYLQNQNINETATALDLPVEMVSEVLNKREVREYVDSVFLNVGFNNRFFIRDAIDAVIKRKFAEMEESGLGSGMDIADLLKLSHTMTIEHMKLQIKLKEIEARQAATTIKNQTNVQINDQSIAGGSNYRKLLDILTGNNGN